MTQGFKNKKSLNLKYLRIINIIYNYTVESKCTNSKLFFKEIYKRLLYFFEMKYI